MTPGRYPSISTSAESTSLRTSSTPSASFRSTAIERRPRETTSALPADKRPRELSTPPPPGSRSTRITVAPRSASIIPAKGPGPMPDISTTVVPDRGPVPEAGPIPAAGPASTRCPISAAGPISGTQALAHEGAQSRHDVSGKRCQEPGLVMARSMEDQVVEPEVQVGLDLGQRRLGIGGHDPAAGHLLDRERVAGSLHLRRVAQAVLLLGCQ